MVRTFHALVACAVVCAHQSRFPQRFWPAQVALEACTIFTGKGVHVADMCGVSRCGKNFFAHTHQWFDYLASRQFWQGQVRHTHALAKRCY